MPEMQSHRRAVAVAWIGFALITLVLILTLLVLGFKPQFGGLVGPSFLPILSVMIVVGGLLMLGGAWMLRGIRTNWKPLVLGAFGFFALISPAFGYLFLFPFAFLAILWAPVVFLLVTLRRA